MLALTKTILALGLSGCSVTGIATGIYFSGKGSSNQEELQKDLIVNEQTVNEKEVIWDWVSIEKGVKKCQRVIKETDFELDNICGKWSQKISVSEGDKDYLRGEKEEVRKKVDDWKKVEC